MTAQQQATIIIQEQGGNAMNFAQFEFNKVYETSKGIPVTIAHHDELIKSAALTTYWSKVVLEIFLTAKF